MEKNQVAQMNRVKIVKLRGGRVMNLKKKKQNHLNLVSY